MNIKVIYYTDKWMYYYVFQHTLTALFVIVHPLTPAHTHTLILKL